MMVRWAQEPCGMCSLYLGPTTVSAWNASVIAVTRVSSRSSFHGLRFTVLTKNPLKCASKSTSNHQRLDVAVFGPVVGDQDRPQARTLENPAKSDRGRDRHGAYKVDALELLVALFHSGEELADSCLEPVQHGRVHEEVFGWSGLRVHLEDRCLIEPRGQFGQRGGPGEVRDKHGVVDASAVSGLGDAKSGARVLVGPDPVLGGTLPLVHLGREAVIELRPQVVGHMTLAGRDHQWLAEAADTVAGQANTVAQQLFPSNCCCRGRRTTLFAVE